MGVHWTTEEQREYLAGYKQQFTKVQSSTSARTALIDKVLTEFEAKWGPDTWSFNGMDSEFKGTEEHILKAKRSAMFSRIEKWFRNNSRVVGDAKSKSTPVLLPLSANVRGIRESDGKPRHRMAKATDKYYELFIKPDIARRNLLSSMYEAHKAACDAKGESPGTQLNWRVKILAEWLAEEEENVRQEVERARKKEMGFDVEGTDITNINGSTSASDNSAEKTAQDAERKKRLERVQKQENAISRLPASLFSVAQALEGMAMAKGVILLGAPVPSRDGKIMIFKRNIGTTLDTKETFESLVGENFNAHVLSPFAEFLVKAFPQDVAQQMSLKSVLDDVPVLNAQAAKPGLSEQSEAPTAMEVVDCTESSTILGQISSSTAIADTSGVSQSKGPHQKAKKSRVDAEDDTSSDESDRSLNLPSSDGPSADEDSNSNKPVRSTRKTPYELKRDENLRRNALLLKNLGLDSMDSFFPSKKNPEQPRRPQLGGPVVPTRRSARILSSGQDGTTSTIDLTDLRTSDSPSVSSLGPDADLQSVDPQTSSELLPQDESLRSDDPVSTVASEGLSLAKAQGLPSTDAALDETPASQAQPPLQYTKQSNEITDSMRQPGLELMVPLGVRSTAFEEYLEERQRLLHEPGHSTCTPGELLPPDGMDDTLFQVFHLNDVKPPELRSKAEWIHEAEQLLCQTFSGRFAKLAVRYWIGIEKILEYPGSKEGFSTKDRPAVLAQWFKYGRDYKQTPKSITDLAVHGKEFIKWWVSLQPLARRVQHVDPPAYETIESSLIRPANVEAGGWSRLSVGGKNGIFLVFLMLVWHKRLSKTGQDLAFVELAIYDVCWALDKVLEDLKTHGRTENGLEDLGPRKRSAEVPVDTNESPRGQDSKARKKQRSSAPVPTTRRTRARA